MWDATCPDIFAPSYTGQATTAVGEVAAQAEQRKCTKYSALPVSHMFVPVAIETAWSNRSTVFEVPSGVG